MLDKDHDLMTRAFKLVDPHTRAMKLAAEGKISLADAQRKTWKDEISALVTAEQMKEAQVTRRDIEDAVIYFTATTPDIEEDLSGTLFVRAIGYRMGPAGP